MISSVHLSNWRSHGDSVLEFGKGTNLLIGTMGAGKSSVLDAISFALFGTFPALERRKLTLDDILRLNENSASVALEFHWNGNKYKVERKLAREKKGAVSDAFIYKDNSLVDKGPKAATTYIEQLLNVDYDLFTRAIYSEQNNIDYFLTVDPKRRKEELDTLLGLDKFEIARANIVSVINRIKSNKKLLEERFNRDSLILLKQKKAGHDSRIEQLRKNADEQELGLMKEKAEVEYLQKVSEELRSKKDSYERLRNETIRLEAIIENLKREIAGKDFDPVKLEKLKQEKSALDRSRSENLSKMKALDGDYAKLSKEIAAIEEKIRITEKTRQEIVLAEKRMHELSGGETLGMLVEKQNEMGKNVLAASSEKVACLNEIAELEKYSKALPLETLVCPLCGSGLTKESLEHVVQERHNKITSNKARISNLEKEIQKNKDIFDALIKSIKSIELLNEKIKGMKELLHEEGSKEKRDALLQSMKDLDAKKLLIYDYSNKLSRDIETLAISISELDAVGKRIAQLKVDEIALASASAKLKQFDFNNEQFEAVRSGLENKRLEHQKHLSELLSIKNELKLLVDMAVAVEKEIIQLVGLEADINKLMKMEEELIIYKNSLLETQLSLRSDLMEAINLAMNEIWQIFYPYKNYKQLRLNVTEKDYAFEIFDSDWKPLESIASGGERACAALTLRVALSTVLTPNLSWLILDEPTHNLDKEAVEMLSHALQFKVPSVISQTFVITHEEGLMGSEFASSYRLMRDKDNFGETKIERV